MLVVNGHAKHRRSLCRVGYGKVALSMNLKILQNKRFLTSVRNDRYAIVIALSTLTTFAVRNPRGATCSCTTRDPLLQRLSKLRFPLSSLLFALCSVGFAQVALARHSKSKLFLCTRLLATFSVLCLHFSFLPNIEKCTYLFGCSFRSSRSAVAAEHVLLRLL